MAILRSVLALFRSRQDQAVVELALRQQIAIFSQRHPRPRLSTLDRAFWVALSRLWPRWKNALVIVQPETVVRWHRKGFRRYWRSISTPGPGRPPIAEEIRRLIVQMATENPWRARKIRAELSKLGIVVSLATISRYLPKAKPDPGSQQRWLTFLRNHRDGIAGMDFFVVPTVRFHLLYVWFAIDHGRRRILHFNVTANPVAHWVVQQLREAFPDGPAHRFLIFDNDSIFSTDVAQSIRGFGIQPRGTAFRSPWQNGTAERFRRNGSSRAARSPGGVERRAPETAAPRVRRVLQRGARPHLNWRLAGRALVRNEAVEPIQDHPAPASGRPPRTLHLARCCLSTRMNNGYRHSRRLASATTSTASR